MKSTTKLATLLATALLFCCFSSVPAVHAAVATEINGITFADHATVGGKNLMLNGLGLRQATFLKVNVYAGALYLEAPSHDGDQIAMSPGLKRIEMVFMRDVGASKIKDAWDEGCEKNCGDAREAMKPGITKLQSITPDMNKGDKMAFSFFADHVEVTVKDQKPVSIDGKEFAKTLILLWIGHKPPNSELKAGMLGVKE
jgi:hypothetical protein